MSSLRYTTFSYSWSVVPTGAGLSTDTLAGGGAVSVACVVKNTGTRIGDAVVLGFANSSDPQFPRQKLFDFARVTLRPGAETTVVLNATANDLSIVDDEGRRWLRPASFTLRAGDVAAPASCGITVGGAPRLLEDLGLGRLGLAGNTERPAP